MAANQKRAAGLLFALALLASSAGLFVSAQSAQEVGTWAPTGAIADGRTGAASVTLGDGTTLIAGGVANGTPTGTVLRYDPATNSLVGAGQLLSARVGHSATALADGRVLVIGGQVDAAPSSDIELFDPASGGSTLIGQLSAPRTRHAAARISDTVVLVVGGANADGVVLDTVERVNVSTGAVSAGPNRMLRARAGASATTLIDGRVLVAGGSNGSADLQSAELYIPWSNSFELTVNQLSVPRSGHTAVLLPNNGGVLIAGGNSSGTAQASVDLLVPVESPDPFSYGPNAFVATAAMAGSRAGAAAGPGREGYSWVDGGGAAGSETYRFATIKTDKDDYAPGERAVITGSGWLPNSEVRLVFQEDPAVHADYVLTVPSDAAGNIYWDEWAPEQHDLGVRFYLSASDSRSRAQTTFTDGVLELQITSPTTLTPATVTTLPGSVTISFNYRTNGSGGTITGVARVKSGATVIAMASKTLARANGAQGANDSIIVTIPTGTANDSYDAEVTVSNVGGSGNPESMTDIELDAVVVNTVTAPVAAAQSVATNEDTALTITLSSSDANGDDQTFSIATDPSHGTVALIGSVSCSGTTPRNCTRQATYTPASNYNGPDSFTFTSSDGVLTSAEATVTIAVRPVNDAPTAVDHGVSTPEDTAVAIDLGALVSDVETADANLSYSIQTSPSSGTLSGSGPNRTYTPATNFNGVVTFTYRVTDRGDPDNCSPVVANVCTAALSSGISTVTITVTPSNDVPIADNKQVATNEDTGTAVTLSGTDVETLPANLSFSVTVGPAHGTLTGTAPNLTYTPNANYNGSDTFQYTVTDRGDPENCSPGPACAGSATSSPATVTITVRPVNDRPTANDHAATTVEDSAGLAIDLGALVSDVETSDANLAYVIVSGPSHGTLNGSGPNRTFIPTANFNGADSFTYKVTDRGDPDNCGPAVPNICTDILESLTRTVTITVTPVNDMPTADGKIVTTDEDTPAAVVLTGTDVETAAANLSFTVTVSPLHGTLSGTAPNLTYTPHANFNGSDSFTYTATDRGDPDTCGTPGPSCAAALTSAPATVNITVRPVNDKPTATDHALATPEDVAAPIDLSALVSDVETGDAFLTYTIVTGPSFGVVSGTGANRTYTPAANFNGSDSFTYKVTDRGDPDNCGAIVVGSCTASLDSDEKTVTITVRPVNDVPVADNKNVTTPEDTATSIALSGSDVETPVSGLTYTVSAPAHGTLSGTAPNLIYTPNANYFGSDSFTYAVTDRGDPDGCGTPGPSCAAPQTSASATVTITVTPVNDPPVVVLMPLDSSSINENTGVSLRGMFTDPDVGDAHSVEISWGDGSVNSVVLLAPGYFMFNVPHTYQDDNPTGTAVDINTISVKVTDTAATTGGIGPLSGYATTAIEVRNVNPVVAALTNLPLTPVPVGTSVTLPQSSFTDVGLVDSHTCTVDWGDGSAQSFVAGSGSCASASHIYEGSGVFPVTLTVTDDDGGVGTSRFEYVVVYPPDGHVTGGGWINSPAGAYIANPQLVGKANFGFVSKYKRGQSVPDGQTEFQFKAGNLDFHSISYEWLVVSGARAQFFGTGAIKGLAGEYWFKLTAIDGQLNGGGGQDRFRIKIWVKQPDGGDGPVVYDNQLGYDDNGNASTALSGGSIVIHNPK